MPIVRPIVTEKSMRLVPDGKYIFETTSDMNKIEVSKDIKKRYQVDVKSVNILNVKGKVKRFKRIIGKRPNVKKVIVTLKAGQKINEFALEKK